MDFCYNQIYEYRVWRLSWKSWFKIDKNVNFYFLFDVMNLNDCIFWQQILNLFFKHSLFWFCNKYSIMERNFILRNLFFWFCSLNLYNTTHASHKDRVENGTVSPRYSPFPTLMKWHLDLPTVLFLFSNCGYCYSNNLNMVNGHILEMRILVANLQF